MIATLTGAGRQLIAHWPSIMAWFLAGVLVNWAVIEVAGWVGAFSAWAGAMLLPLAILARLISYVAMFLVVRDGMRTLRAVAPLPDTPAERRREFVPTLLASILPFVAFYGAWGLLRDDVTSYYQRVLEVQTEYIFAEGVEPGDGQGGWLELSIWTLLLIVAAFVLRWVLERWSGRLPRWSVWIAIYLELIWVFLSITVLTDLIDTLLRWVETRQALVWVDDLRGWLAEQLLPAAWLWQAVEWFVGEAVGILSLPIAWLVIAAIIYGQAASAATVRVPRAVAERARRGWARAPRWITARATGLWGGVVERVRPVGEGLLLVWRAGPLYIGYYVLLYTLLLGLESLVSVGITRIFGPNELGGFWLVNDQLILLAIPLIIEPLRIVLVSSSYDHALGIARQGSTTSRSSSRGASELDITSQNGPEASSGTR